MVGITRALGTDDLTTLSLPGILNLVGERQVETQKGDRPHAVLNLFTSYIGFFLIIYSLLGFDLLFHLPAGRWPSDARDPAPRASGGVFAA